MLERIIKFVRSLPRWGKLALLVGVIAVLVVIFVVAIISPGVFFPLIALGALLIVCWYSNEENEKLAMMSARNVREEQIVSACGLILYEIMSDSMIYQSLGIPKPSSIEGLRPLSLGAVRGCSRLRYRSLRLHGNAEFTLEEQALYREVIQNGITQRLLTGNYISAPFGYFGYLPAIYVYGVEASPAEVRVDVLIIPDERAAMNLTNVTQEPCAGKAEYVDVDF